MPDDILAVTDNAGYASYIDLKTSKPYDVKPEVLKFGKIEMLRVGMLYYSRTKNVYKSPLGMNGFDLVPRDSTCGFTPTCLTTASSGT